MTVAKSHN